MMLTIIRNKQLIQIFKCGITDEKDFLRKRIDNLTIFIQPIEFLGS